MKYKVTRTWYLEVDKTHDAIKASKNWKHQDVSVERVDEFPEGIKPLKRGLTFH